MAEAGGQLVIDIEVNVFVEVYVQTFLNICAGGPCDQDFTITQTCTRDVPCMRPAVPPGSTVTVRECGCAESTIVTVTEPWAIGPLTSLPMGTTIPAGGAGAQVGAQPASSAVGAQAVAQVGAQAEAQAEPQAAPQSGQSGDTSSPSGGSM